MSSAATGQGMPQRVPRRSVRSRGLRFVRTAVAFVVFAGSLGLATATATAQTGAGTCPTVGAEGYSDAESGSPTHRNDIACLKELGISEDVAAYRPLDNMTRSEMAAFMVKAYEALTEMDAPSATHMFGDVAGDPNAAHIARLVGLNITKGTSPTTFSPDDPVTRGHMALFLTRLYKAVLASDAPIGATPFTDLGSVPSQEQRDAIGQIYELDITKGTTPTTFSPRNNVTRQQMASFVARLYRHIDALEIPEPPDAPTGVEATVSGTEGDSLDVSWEASDGADSYVVQWKSGAADYSDDNQRSVDDTKTNFDDLTKGTAYTFRVAGVNSRGTGEWSDEASASPGTVPGAVSAFAVVPGAVPGTLELSWAAPADDGGTPITGYKVQWAVGRNAPSTTEINSASATSHTITGLRTGVSYRVHIQAVNAAGDGAITAPADAEQRTVTSATSVGAGSVKPVLPTLADDPAGFRKGGRFASLTWRRPVLRNGEHLLGIDDGAYQIQRKCGTEAWPATHSGAQTATQERAGTPTATVTLEAAHVALIGGAGNPGTLTNGEQCSFRVRARTFIDRDNDMTQDTGETTVVGAWVTGTGTPLGVPGMPTDVAVEKANRALKVTWTAPMTTDSPPKVNDGGTRITGYKIAWASGGPEGDTTVSASATSHTITGLTNTIEYTVTIQAVNARGASEATTGVAAIPAAVPAAPTGVRVSHPRKPATGETDYRGSRLIVRWNAPPGNGTGAVESYEVERRASATTDPVAAAGAWGRITHTGTGTMVNDDSVTRGTSYDYRVRAVNGAGSGPWSRHTSAASGTPSGLPTEVDLTTLEIIPGYGLLILTWNAPAGGGSDVTHYHVRYARNRDGTERWTSPRRVNASALPTTTLSGLRNGDPYIIGIKAFNTVGESPESVTAGDSTPIAGFLAGPTRVTAVPSPTDNAAGTSLHVEWSAVGGASAYEVEYLDTTASPVGGWSSVTVPTPQVKVIGGTNYFDAAKAREVTITGLTQGTTYVVRVRPVTQALVGGERQDTPVVGNPRSSAPVKAESTPETAPSVVAALTQPEKTTTLRVTWTPPANAAEEGITGYRITWYPTRTQVVGNRGEATVAATARSYNITGLNAFGEEITVTVAGVNKVGVGAAGTATGTLERASR